MMTLEYCIPFDGKTPIWGNFEIGYRDTIKQTYSNVPDAPILIRSTQMDLDVWQDIRTAEFSNIVSSFSDPQDWYNPDRIGVFKDGNWVPFGKLPIPKDIVQNMVQTFEEYFQSERIKTLKSNLEELTDSLFFATMILFTPILLYIIPQFKEFLHIAFLIMLVISVIPFSFVKNDWWDNYIE